MAKLYTTQDLITIVKNTTSTEITLRTAQRWLEGYQPANDQQKPLKYTEETIKKVMNEHRKKFKLTTELPINLETERINRIKAERESIENFDVADHYESIQNFPEFNDEKTKKKSDVLAIKIMLKALLNSQNLFFDEEQLLKDMLTVDEQLFYADSYADCTPDFFLAEDRINWEDYISRNEI